MQGASRPGLGDYEADPPKISHSPQHPCTPSALASSSDAGHYDNCRRWVSILISHVHNLLLILRQLPLASWARFLGLLFLRHDSPYLLHWKLDGLMLFSLPLLH
jgi:hypothetical protein